VTRLFVCLSPLVHTITAYLVFTAGGSFSANRLTYRLKIISFSAMLLSYTTLNLLEFSVRLVK